MSHTALSRRTLLRGTGTLMALPLLEAMLPRTVRAQTAAAPRRLAVFYVPCGIHMAKWTPSASGRGWAPTPTLQPLVPVKDDVLVLTGLSHWPGRPELNGHHAAGTAAFLTCARARKTAGTDIYVGISMDQVIANHLQGATRFPSLELGNDAGTGVRVCDANYSCAYAYNIAWAGPSSPRPKETRPRAVFHRLFAGFDPGESQAELEKRRAYERSILDFVREDARALQGRLGATDRRKLDEYLTSVRELERRLDALEPDGPVCQPGEAPVNTDDVRAKTQVMMDLIVLAFQCDLTRVVTFMLGNARSDRVYDFLGLSDTHHTYSHHQRVQSNYDALAKIDRWEVEQYAYLLQRLKAVRETDGSTLLDSAFVYFGSEVEDGNSHGHSNMPVVVAGRGGGALTPGRHVRYSGEPLANLFISLMQGMGVNRSTFGADGTGPLQGLKE
jgi:hypothetical protein